MNWLINLGKNRQKPDWGNQHTRAPKRIWEREREELKRPAVVYWKLRVDSIYQTAGFPSNSKWRIILTREVELFRPKLRGARGRKRLTRSSSRSMFQKEQEGEKLLVRLSLKELNAHWKGRTFSRLRLFRLLQECSSEILGFMYGFVWFQGELFGAVLTEESTWTLGLYMYL